jgi:hypothetical protein
MAVNKDATKKWWAQTMVALGSVMCFMDLKRGERSQLLDAGQQFWLWAGGFFSSKF